MPLHGIFCQDAKRLPLRLKATGKFNYERTSSVQSIQTWLLYLSPSHPVLQPVRPGTLRLRHRSFGSESGSGSRVGGLTHFGADGTSQGQKEESRCPFDAFTAFLEWPHFTSSWLLAWCGVACLSLHPQKVERCFQFQAGFSLFPSPFLSHGKPLLAEGRWPAPRLGATLDLQGWNS